jgi:hypothetical protein
VPTERMPFGRAQAGNSSPSFRGFYSTTRHRLQRGSTRCSIAYCYSSTLSGVLFCIKDSEMFGLASPEYKLMR